MSVRLWSFFECETMLILCRKLVTYIKRDGKFFARDMRSLCTASPSPQRNRGERCLFTDYTQIITLAYSIPLFMRHVKASSWLPQNFSLNFEHSPMYFPTSHVPLCTTLLHCVLPANRMQVAIASDQDKYFWKIFSMFSTKFGIFLLIRYLPRKLGTSQPSL